LEKEIKRLLLLQLHGRFSELGRPCPVYWRMTAAFTEARDTLSSWENAFPLHKKATKNAPNDEQSQKYLYYFWETVKENSLYGGSFEN